MALQIKKVKIDSIYEDPANARQHSKDNIDSIKGSIRQFGQVEPLVVQQGTGRVIAGNGRLQAMKALGFEEVSIVELEISDIGAASLAIAMNRTGELAEWNYEVLGAILHELKDEFDLHELGWPKSELDILLAADWEPPEPKGDIEKDFEENKTIKVTSGQYEVIERAVERLSELEGEEIGMGRALELICAEYLSGA